jgi:hypothetical protein
MGLARVPGLSRSLVGATGRAAGRNRPRAVTANLQVKSWATRTRIGCRERSGSNAPKGNSTRLSPLDYSRLRGEGSTPVPLPPPVCRRPCVLQANSRAIKPSNSSDFSFELRTPDRRSRSIFLRKTRFSPKLWTPSIRYGSRNSNVWSYL